MNLDDKATSADMWNLTTYPVNVVSASVADARVVAPITLAPNPAREFIVLHGVPANTSSLTLTNATGESVRQLGKPTSSDVRLELSGLASGTYFARIVSPTGVTVRKIVKD